MPFLQAKYFAVPPGPAHGSKKILSGSVNVCRLLCINFASFCSGCRMNCFPALVFSALNTVSALEDLGTLHVTLVLPAYSDKNGE